MPSAHASTDRVLVLDSGGGVLKAGLASNSRPTVCEPNCTASVKPKRGFGAEPPAIGSAVLDLAEYVLHRPTQRGLLLDLEQQRVIWENLFSKHLRIDPREHALLLTEAPFSPAKLRHEVAEMVFESFGFRELCIATAPPLAMRSPDIVRQLDQRNPCCTVLDVGFSSSVALPCVEGQMVASAGRRLNVGGRVLTNLLSERLHFAHYDLTQSWLVAEDIMSKTCEVSTDFEADLHEGYRQVDPMTYVLPDFQTHSRGFVADAVPSADAQRVTVKAERVVVPEMLFSPKDHGIHQVGVADLVRHSIRAVTAQSWRPHFGQVVVCGGLARLPNFCSRLFRDLRQSAPTDWPISVIVEEEPELSVWRGAAQLARDSHFRRTHFRSRRAWEEEGTRIVGSTGEKPAAKRVRT